MYNRSIGCSEHHMGIGYVSVLKHAVKLGGLLMPFLVIGGLLLLWALIVIVCLNFGPLSASLLGGNILLH
jgi:hypothetical protein